MNVQPAAEPEVILQHIVHRVSQLERKFISCTPACTMSASVVWKALVHPPQESRMNVVLGVEHAGDRARTMRRARVQRLGLALGPAVESTMTLTRLGVAVGDAFGYLPGRRVVVADDDEQLEGRMVTADQPGSVCSSTASSCRAGTISENEQAVSRPSASRAALRSSESGVRQA